MSSGEGRPSCAESLFSDNLESFLRELDKRWMAIYGQCWVASKESFLKAVVTVHQLLEAHDSTPLNDEDRINLALALHTLGRSEAAIDWIEPIRNTSPKARFVYALVLHELGAGNWISEMEKGVREVEFRVPASKILMEHFTSTGDRMQVQRLRNLLKADDEFADKAQQNMSTFNRFWSYVPSNWTVEEKTRIAEILAEQGCIARAYLVDRTTKDPRHRHTCLLITPRWNMTDARAVLRRITSHVFPHNTMVYVPNVIPRAAKQVPGALVYDCRWKDELKCA